jgi:hypothetical protein
MSFMAQHYAPAKLLVLVLAARRSHVRYLPDELWLMLLEDYVIPA